MLVTLNPGLVCKNCKERMTMGRDRSSNVNMVIREDSAILNEDFECIITCNHCSTEHIAKGLIRHGEFKGIYEYRERHL